MDDIDRKLLILVGGNPRMHLQELARLLGVSKQAVHHRMHALTDAGVVVRATANLSVSYVDAVPVAVFGRSRTDSTKKMLERLGKSEFTRRVLLASGNNLFLVGFLRDISELDGYIEFVRREAEMVEPTVGIFCLDDGLMPYYPVDGSGSLKKSHRALSPLDLKIIASLQDDARKPVSQIANSVHASSKTVRRHLDRMISDGALELQLCVDLARSGDVMVVASLRLRDGASKVAIGRRLLSEAHFMDQYIRTYSNIPDLLHWVFWSYDIDQIRRGLEKVSEYEDVISVVPHFCYLERLYPTWRDRLLVVKQRASTRPDRHVTE